MRRFLWVILGLLCFLAGDVIGDTLRADAQQNPTLEERVAALERMLEANDHPLPPVAPASEVMFGGIAVVSPEYSFQLVCENDGVQLDQVFLTCMRVDFSK